MALNADTRGAVTQGTAAQGTATHDAVALVCGRKIVQVEGSALRKEAAGYRRVVVDLGAGDGRFAYRLARASPSWLVIAVDANPAGMREISRRACCKPSRGGAPNVRFVRAAAGALPGGLDGIADEILILYPWGSLLRAVIVPDVTMLRGIARLGKPGASVHVRVNALALGDSELAAGPGRPAQDHEDSRERLASAYKTAGLQVVRWTWEPGGPPTSWGKRLSHGSPGRVLALDARVEPHGWEHHPPRL
jgi:16S rRNA (adenine(1408)-N(1))-methyltransferase